MNSLIGSKLKIERADGQIREVTEALVTFLRGHIYELIEERNAAKGEVNFKLRLTKRLPDEIAVVTAEALYNLRSALDQAFYAASSRNEVEVTERPGFPIERTKKKFESTLFKRKIQDRLPALANYLRELKPYETGNLILWRLHVLSGTDKHKMLVPIGGVHFATNVQLRGTSMTDFANYRFGVPRTVHRLDEDVVLLTYPTSMKLDGKIEVLVDVAFRNVDRTKIESAVATLQQFRNVTSGIIGAMEQRFLST